MLQNNFSRDGAKEGLVKIKSSKITILSFNHTQFLILYECLSSVERKNMSNVFLSIKLKSMVTKTVKMSLCSTEESNTDL